MKRISLLFIILALLIVAVVAAVKISSGRDSPGRNNEELLRVITHTFPNLTSEGKPVIQIDSVSRHHDDWYIVTIKSLRQTGELVPVRVVLLDQQENNVGLQVLLGPDTYFSKRETLAFDLPDSVIIELEKL